MAKKLENHEQNNLRDLKLLEEIEKNPSISQRDLSGRLGVALGIANSLIKTLVRRGMIKIKGENNRSLSYHLTHAGVLHKSRLAMQWTFNTIGEYRRLRSEISKQLIKISGDKIEKVLIYGANELAEIAVMVAPESGLEVVGIVDGDTDLEWVAGRKVSSLKDISGDSYDAIINCSNKKLPVEIKKKVYDLLSEHSWV